MNTTTVLIEPTDLLFFRDSLPMAAGQGRGHGCRLPFPTTLHEAFRSSLLRARGEQTAAKKQPGRPRNAPRRGDWRVGNETTDVFFASEAFRSLRTAGPYPWHQNHGILFPIPHDAKLSQDREQLLGLDLWWWEPSPPEEKGPPASFQPHCLPLATTPGDKRGQLRGWWTMGQYQAYLRGNRDNKCDFFKPIQTDDLWQPEHRIGVQIDSSRSAATPGQLYGATYLRAKSDTRFVAQLIWGDGLGQNTESTEIQNLSWLLLGGEFRLARLWHREETKNNEILTDLFSEFQNPPEPERDGPCLLKWSLVSPAIFAHGHLPGWCCDTRKDRPGGPLPLGQVCLDLPGSAHLVSWCLGKPRSVSGWDIVDDRPKPTLLAVPEGGVYYFVCENRDTAKMLARKLHWKPRSDFYGEKGCGYGLCSFADRPTPDFVNKATELFIQRNKL